MPAEIKKIEKSAEHLRLEGIANEFPEGTRKGDDARAKLRDIERNLARDRQLNEGKGQFIREEPTKPGRKITTPRGR